MIVKTITRSDPIESKSDETITPRDPIKSKSDQKITPRDPIKTKSDQKITPSDLINTKSDRTIIPSDLIKWNVYERGRGMLTCEIGSAGHYNPRMLQRVFAAALFLLAVAASAAPAKSIAPSTVPHPVAMFLSSLCAGGKQKVTFKAAASGTRFFFEEPAGVTVYVFDGTGYRKEAFLKSATLASAMKRYGSKP